MENHTLSVYTNCVEEDLESITSRIDAALILAGIELWHYGTTMSDTNTSIAFLAPTGLDVDFVKDILKTELAELYVDINYNKFKL